MTEEGLSPAKLYSTTGTASVQVPKEGAGFKKDIDKKITMLYDMGELLKK